MISLDCPTWAKYWIAQSGNGHRKMVCMSRGQQPTTKAHVTRVKTGIRLMSDRFHPKKRQPSARDRCSPCNSRRTCGCLQAGQCSPGLCGHDIRRSRRLKVGAQVRESSHQYPVQQIHVFMVARQLTRAVAGCSVGRMIATLHLSREWPDFGWMACGMWRTSPASTGSKEREAGAGACCEEAEAVLNESSLGQSSLCMKTRAYRSCSAVARSEQPLKRASHTVLPACSFCRASRWCMRYRGGIVCSGSSGRLSDLLSVGIRYLQNMQLYNMRLSSIRCAAASVVGRQCVCVCVWAHRNQPHTFAQLRVQPSSVLTHTH